MAASLVGLAGLAITQPVLDIIGGNPEFFVAGRYTTTQVVEFGLLVALAPSAVLAGVFWLVRMVNVRAGDVAHRGLTALLGALFGNVLARGLGGDGLPLAALASLAGATLAVLLVRAPWGRMLLCYLAAGNVLFLAVFLFASPTTALIVRDTDAVALGEVSVPTPPGPVVVVVFDELPMSTLMRTDGTINSVRYPSFARLAAESTWFRNTSSPHSHTEKAVPAILTGMVREERVLPTYTAMPRNLLALLGTGMPVERYESVTDLCPRSVCAAQASQPVRQALMDSVVVLGHRVLPDRLRDHLPRIDEAWGSFGRELDDGPAGVAPAPEDTGGADPLARWHGMERSERNPATQAARLVERARDVDDTASLHFIHVVLPHAPWFITPWSTHLMGPMPKWRDEAPGPAGDWSGYLRYQRHSLQTGAADLALGRVLDHLESLERWEDTTLVVTADHGTSTIPPHVGREPTGDNDEEIFRVPLFVKAAGQREAKVVDDVAMTIDVLPTLIDLLDIQTGWDLDGHSLLDGSEAKVAPRVNPDVRPLFDIVERHADDFPHGWGWPALAAVGERGELVGRSIADLELGPPSDVRWTLNNAGEFASVPDEHGEAPQLVTGRIYPTGNAAPSSLVLVVNGTVAGVAGGYDPSGDGWAFSAMLGPYLRPADNEVVAYEVTGPSESPVLHRLG